MTHKKPDSVAGNIMDFTSLEQFAFNIGEWFTQKVFIMSTLAQLAASMAAFITAYLAAKKPRQAIEEFIHRKWDPQILARYNEKTLLDLIYPLFALVLLWCLTVLAIVATIPSNILEILAKLLTAWIIIRLTSSLLHYPFWSQVIAVTAWGVTALSITGLLHPTSMLLDSVAFEVGRLRISMLIIIKGGFSLAIMLWLAGVLSSLFERRINKLVNVTPSVLVLLSKILRVTLITIALLIGINSLGIDLTALAFFGGAIGIGVGFGLQKVVSNLISGIILLLDRSVKPGDVIEVGGTYGWVNTLGARYVSVLTRDGFEHLIPNEQIITEKVVNWSYSSPKIRLKTPIRIAYSADIPKAIGLVLEAAKANKRVLRTPEPVCLMVGMGDSSINLELRVWIDDPAKGIMNVKSEVLLDIWEKFKANAIQVPFPQGEVRLSASPELMEMVQKLVGSRA